MDAVYFHFAMNHFPVIASIFGLVILGYGVLRRNDPLTSTGLLIMVVTALVAIPVYLTGEPAEEGVEGLPGVIETLIESHEDFAMFALISAIVSGAVSLVALLFSRARFESTVGRILVWASLGLAVVTLGTMGWTAKLGGVIRHTEIRAAADQASPAAAETRRKDDHDDDH
ncbi:MAG: hypothetical protein PSX80_17530 [bacterium]|nr:hypothetical protein [bacterium]